MNLSLCHSAPPEFDLKQWSKMVWFSQAFNKTIFPALWLSAACFLDIFFNCSDWMDSSLVNSTVAWQAHLWKHRLRKCINRSLRSSQPAPWSSLLGLLKFLPSQLGACFHSARGCHVISGLCAVLLQSQTTLSRSGGRPLLLWSEGKVKIARSSLKGVCRVRAFL